MLKFYAKYHYCTGNDFLIDFDYKTHKSKMYIISIKRANISNEFMQIIERITALVFTF